VTKIDEDIEKRLVALTRDLILIPSIPTREDDRRRCYEFVKNHIDAIDGIKIKEYEKDGLSSMVATAEKDDNPKILMCGHLDVIAHSDISVYNSKIEGGKIIGPGAGDMKGALAILLEIFRTMHENNPGISLGIAVTSDEEQGGESGIGYLVNEEGISCEEAMIPDGGSLTGITVEEKGILHIQLTAIGKTSHAARPWLGHNPIEHLIERLTVLKNYFSGLTNESDRWYPTCAITIISTENQTTNRIPHYAQAICDIRFPPPYTDDKLLKEIRKCLGQDIEVEIIIQANPSKLDPDPLYQKIVEEVIGEKAQLIKDDGGSDARFLSVKGIPILMSRPTVGNLHAEDEWIDIHSMLQVYKIYEKFISSKLLNSK